MLWILHLSCLVAALQINSEFIRSFNGRIDQITDDLVTVGRDADFLAPAHQFANHARAGKGFARSWRTLDRQDSGSQMFT